VPVLERDDLLVGCPQATRAPYELLIAPLTPAPSGLTSALLAPAVRLLAAAVRRLHALHNSELPLNAWLLEGEHWRIEVLPRTTRFAGLELGADVYVTSVAPETAAGALAAL
jgi:hypothetical protein